MQYIVLFRPQDKEDHFERYARYDGFLFSAKNSTDATIQIEKIQNKIRKEFENDISPNETFLVGNIYQPVMKFTKTGSKTMFFRNIITGQLIHHSKFPNHRRFYTC